MKVLFAGGGTLGSVSPLIAVYIELKKRQPQTVGLFLGSRRGPEAAVVTSYKIPFRPIASGRLRRYWDWRNFSDPFLVLAGFVQSLGVIIFWRPQVVMVAGSFVGVPVAWAAWLLRVPVLIHQQDIVAGLANKLMANSARKITVSFAGSLKDFSPHKTILTGNPVRPEFFACRPTDSRSFLSLKSDWPVLLVLGGGTGARFVNELVEQTVSDLTQFCQIIHITGKGKKIDLQAPHYHQFELLTTEMIDALCSADVVVSRAGLSTLSELTVLGKASIIIPMPDTHQEYNAHYFQQHQAAIVLSQKGLKPPVFVGAVRELIDHPQRREQLAQHMEKIMDRQGAHHVAQTILDIAKL